MKVIRCIQPGTLAFEYAGDPVLKAEFAIIKIKRIGICGTDLHAFEGVQPYFSYPRILGHEISGEIVEIDQNDELKIGDLVTVIPYFNCGLCSACKKGKSNCCKNISVCGVHEDGGMVEFLLVPISSLVKGNGLDVDELALVEPFAIGAHGVRRSCMQENDSVLIVGAGPIGLATASVALAKGASVILIDVNTDRLLAAKALIGVKHIINAADPGTKELIKDVSNGNMPELVFDCSGNLQAINQGFEFLEHGGTYILIGLQRGVINLNHPEFHKKEATLMSSRNATREDFDFVLQYMKKNIIYPKGLITHRVAFKDAVQSFPSFLDPANKVIKAMVEL